MDRTSLEGRVAIVTGGASGIGRGTVKVLASRGASVVVADINAAGAQTVADEVVSLGGKAAPVTVDVAEESQVAAMVEAAVRAFGRLDILHNNAGLTDTRPDQDVVTMDVAVWDRTMAINLRGPMLGCKHAIPRMLETGGGAIVNTSSGSGLRGTMGGTAYGASKAALLSLTRSVAAQYGRDGIRCNAIIPTAATEAVAAYFQRLRASDDGEADWPQLELPLLGRQGTPEDIGEAVAFLVSDAASFITGHALFVNGGQDILQPHWATARRRYEQARVPGTTPPAAE